MTEPVLHVEGLHVSAGGRDIVGGVSFALSAGQTLALVGESGSGKTTTALALLGEHPHGARLTGGIRVAGQEVTPGRPPRPGTLAYIPQHPSTVLNPVRRIGAVLREIAARHRTEAAAPLDARVATSLRRARLPCDPAFLRRYPHQLSGGQQQRLVLAQALICDPAVIIADEPTTGQDAVTRREVVAELSDLVRHGIAIVLLTHDLDVVRALASQIVVLRAGQVIETGPATTVMARPQHDYTRALIAAQCDIATTRAPEPRAQALTETTARLRVTELSARHRAGRREVTVLHGIELEVRAGECLAVIGRSGSGKTTLARCVAGLHPPSGGAVQLEGHPLARTLRRRSRSDLARVQYVFQDARASFDHHRPILDQVGRTAVRLRGMTVQGARGAAEEALAEVGLPGETVRRRPAELSGGELQRAALARALLAEPDILICDEITSGLDTLTQAGILDQLSALRREYGLTLVVISHDLGVVARVADHVAVIHEGRLVERGTTADVLGDPRHPVTKGLLRLQPSDTGRT